VSPWRGRNREPTTARTRHGKQQTEPWRSSFLGQVLLNKLGARALAVAGIVLLVLCAWWWTLSVKRNHLANGQRTWIPPANVLGIDFLNNYYAARHWHKGGDPYHEQFGDPLRRPFIYAPVMLVLFGWCRFFSAWQAVIVWMAALTLMTVIAAVMCGRNRKQLNLWPLPLPFVVAALLCSTPIAFEMERGNCDMLVLMLLLLAGALLPKRSLGNDVLAGGCLALAVWIKVYAGVLGLGLLALRRPRACRLHGAGLRRVRSG